MHRRFRPARSLVQTISRRRSRPRIRLIGLRMRRLRWLPRQAGIRRRFRRPLRRRPICRRPRDGTRCRLPQPIHPRRMPHRSPKRAVRGRRCPPPRGCPGCPRCMPRPPASNPAPMAAFQRRLFIRRTNRMPPRPAATRRAKRSSRWMRLAGRLFRLRPGCMPARSAPRPVSTTRRLAGWAFAPRPAREAFTPRSCPAPKTPQPCSRAIWPG